MNKNGEHSQLPLFQDQGQAEILDFSSLSIFQRCPLEYKYRYSPRNTDFDPRGSEILLGRILHSVSSRYLSKPQNERNESFDSQEYLQKFAKYFDYRNHGHYEIALKAINYLRNGPLSQLAVHAIEFPFRKPFKNLLLVGRVDCIGRESQIDLIVDLKLDPSELEHHHNSQTDRFLQLIFYYYGVKDSISLNLPHLAYYFFVNGSFEMIEVTDKLISSGLEEIQRLNKDRKEMKTFLPRKSRHCLTCAVMNRSLCPLWKGERPK